MKIKALRKKLNLKKETVSDLNHSELKNIQGYGEVSVIFTICCTIGCPTMVDCDTIATCNPTGLIDCQCGIKQTDPA